MGEVRKEDESTLLPIDIFVCYAREDEEYRQRLEKHLAIFQKEGLIHIWHDGKISPGEEWEQVIHTQLNTAQIVLFLLSPDFIASEYCYSVEMKKALERHIREEVRVIPIIIRPINWENTPLGKLQVLPKDAKPIALWRNRDAAFLDVEKGIRRVIEEVQAQSFTFTPSLLSQKESQKSLQKTYVMEEASLPEMLVAKRETCQESPGASQMLITHQLAAPEDASLSVDERISSPRNKNSRKRALLVSSIIILSVLAVCLIPFLSLPTCSFAICPSSLQLTKQPTPQHEGETQDQNLSISLVAVVSPSFVLLGDPKRYSGGITPPTDISAVLLPQNPSTYDTIIINVQNRRYGGADIFIDYVGLKLLSVPALPRPLKVWTPGVTTTYIGYPYPVKYTGQQPGQLLYAEPAKHVTLSPAGPGKSGESDSLSIQVMSTVTAYLRFQVEITYQIVGAPRMLILPQVFQVAFSDASNWQKESL